MLKTNTIIAAAAALIISPFGMSQTQAGDITAEIQGGHLYIYGTDDDSSIAITGAGDYKVQVTGMTTTSGESTTVNGQENGTVILEGWTRGIFIYNYGGDDQVDIQEIYSAGPVTVDQGLGNDQLMIGTDAAAEDMYAMTALDGETSALIFGAGTVELNSYLLVYGGDGDDDVIIRSTYVNRTTTVDMGPGDDYVEAGGSVSGATVFNNNTFILPSTGADEVNFTRMTFQTNLVVDDASGPLTMNVTDTEVGQSSYVYATPDNDSLMASNWNMGDFLLVISEGGNDRVSYSGDNANATFNTGAGRDLLEIYDMNSGNLVVQLADGNDRTWLSSSTLNRFDLYGSTGDDFFKVRSTDANYGYIYGGSGFDTNESSTLYFNMIDDYNTYSIEQETTSVN